MKIAHKLKFDLDDLPEHSRKILENGFMQEDYESYWIDIPSIIDNVDMIFNFPRPGKDIDVESLAVKSVPKVWWEQMAFPVEMVKAMKKFWGEYPGGEIEWTR